jgi:acetylornithine deacetylase/succinyl-diaminopimelate desuccinylase-like protein
VAHTPIEHVRIAELVDAVPVLVRLAERAAGANDL